MEFNTGFAECDGLNIAYQEFGEGPLNVVLVMGLWSHLDWWHEFPGYTDFLTGLGEFARVVTFDKRGFGLSDRWPRDPTLEERMDDVRAVMDHVGMESAAVMSWSEGTPMALLFAATFPERIESLLIFDGFARVTRTDDYPIGATKEESMEFVRRMAATWGTGDFVAAIDPAFNDPHLKSIVARGERMCLRKGEVVRTHEWVNDIDVRDILPALAVPTLVMSRRDGDLADHNRYLADHIAGATLVEFGGHWHAPWGDGDEAEILDTIRSFVGAAPRRTESDRVLATVLFTDIVQSTELATDLGDRRWRRLLDDHDELVRAEVERERGVWIKSTGDGALATFDAPGRALASVRAIRRGTEALGIRIRAGLHTGEIERRGDDVGGLAVNLASRVANEAADGEVLVTRTVADLVLGSESRFDSCGSRELKGIDRPWELFRLAEA